MTYRKTNKRGCIGPAALALVVLGALLFAVITMWRPAQGALAGATGEEQLLPQIKGLTDLAAGAARSPLDLAPETPIRYAHVNPFGINVFLNQEVEPAKREQTVNLAAEAGFHWLRQEFPWDDIEIHAKGDFEDRRNQPFRSAWDKYDQIVALAEQYDMELIVRVSTPPNWTRALGSQVGSFAPPDNYEDFGDFVRALVSRYKGHIRFYQLWNEPNIYPEWGSYPISPEQYTELLKIGATAAREADPNVVIISGALASTISLDASAAPPHNALNDLLFLQRMYDAGAAPYFDIMAMQAYGLWSGPSDQRMHPRVMNFGRPEYVRDLMVANGDAHKAIWISEMAWNAVPDSVADKRFGQVTHDQQGRYEVDAYRRAIAEWPWAGVVNTWYFKRATDDWFRENKPEAYFRLADPDFALQPAYYALKDFMTTYEPVLTAGTHPADDWAVQGGEDWTAEKADATPFGVVWHSGGDPLSFKFEGRELQLVPGCGPAACGSISVSVDGGSPVMITPGQGTGAVPLARGLTHGRHEAVVATAGAGGIAAIVVR